MFKITLYFGADADCRMAVFHDVPALSYDDAKTWAYQMAKHIGLKIEAYDVVRTATTSGMQIKA